MTEPNGRSLWLAVSNKPLLAENWLLSVAMIDSVYATIVKHRKETLWLLQPISRYKKPSDTHLCLRCVVEFPAAEAGTAPWLP